MLLKNRRLLRRNPPGVCYLCGGSSSVGQTLCRACWADLPFSDCGVAGKPEPFSDFFSLFDYQFPVREMLHGLKYRRQFWLGQFFGSALAQGIQQQGLNLPDIIVPVPLHRWRMLGRGYNQALEIARPLSSILSVPLSLNCVRRIRHTGPQFKQPFSRRQMNVHGAFAVSGLPPVRSLAVVDDIYTSGHTATELGRQFRRLGVAEIQLWVVARAP